MVAVVDALGYLALLMIHPCQAHNLAEVRDLLEGHPLEALIGDTPLHAAWLPGEFEAGGE